MFREFPYTNFHELNLDWIVKIAKDFLDQYTHIQEVIQTGLSDLAESRETGLEELNQKTLDGLADLQEKYDTLNGLLQAWYDTHSADIAGQLADAIADFNAAAEAKSQELLDSWPADYSELVTGYNNLKSAINSDYTGKKISIIGDSFSAYNADGYKYPGYAMFYPRPVESSNDVRNVNEMWWKRIIDLCNGQFEVNASLASGMVTYDSNHPDRPTFYERVSLIGSPDVIFVELGTFDAAASVPLGDYDFDTTYTSLSETEFRPAYIKGVKALQATYPNAKIVCIGMDILSTYWRSIRHIALTLGATFIDARPITNLNACPSVYGMIQISDHILHPTDMGLTQWKMPADGNAVGLKFEETNESIDNLRNDTTANFNLLKDENGNLTGYNPQVYETVDISNAPIINLQIASNTIVSDNNSRSFFIVLSPSDSKFIITKSKGKWFRAAFISNMYVKSGKAIYNRVQKDGEGDKTIVIERDSQTYTHLVIQYYSSNSETETPEDIFNTITVRRGQITPIVEYVSETKELIDSYSLLDSRQMTTDDRLFSAVNGAKFRKEINTVITALKHDTEKMLHVPTFVILNNIVYATYLDNYISGMEEFDEVNVRMVFFSLASPETKTYIDICEHGESFDGSTFELLHDSNIAAVDNDTLRITFFGKLADEDAMAVYNRTYTISTGTLSDIERSQFVIYNTSGANTYNLNSTNLKTGLELCGIPHKADTNDATENLVIAQPISYKVVSRTKVYYSTLCAYTCTMIVKTSDFKKWEYVAYIPVNNIDIEGVATYIIDTRVYCYVRRAGAYRPISILLWYDITKFEWSEQSRIIDQGARGFFFMFNDKLYLINNPKGRNRMSVIEINTTTLNLSLEVQECIFTSNIFYPAVQVYNDEIYCIYCANRANLKLCKFTIGSITRPTIYSKLEEIFSIT